MIIIPTCDGGEAFQRLIKSIEKFGPVNQMIIVCDTRPESAEPLETFRQVVCAGPHYTTGAWSWVLAQGFRIHSNREPIVLLHDSMEITKGGWFEDWTERLQGNVGAVALAGFPMAWDSYEQLQWVAKWCPMTQAVKWGFFGCSFATTAGALRQSAIHMPLSEDDHKAFAPCRFPLPTTKLEDTAMERAWPHLFVNAGYEVQAIVPHYGQFLRGEEASIGVRKHFMHRL